MADITASASQYNGAALLITVVVFQVFTWVSVVLRTYVRGILTKSFQCDDWLMLVAQINFSLSCGFIAAGLVSGLGHHNAVLPQVEEILAIKWQAIATGTYITNMMFIKLSIGVFLLRLASQRRYKWIIWISMGIVACMSSALFIWDIFQCAPVAAQWDYTLPSYTCVTPEQVVQAAYALSVLSILSDWLYALLPIPMLWKAKMTPQAKATVSVVLGLGIFASVATLIRVKYLIDLTDADDILYAGTDPMVWTLIEPGVAIVASSLVTIRPLLRQMRLKGFESSEHSRSGGFWGRHAGGLSERYGNRAGSKRSRAASGLPALNVDASNHVSLKDLEAGHGPLPTTTTRSKKQGRGFSSRDTTLTSQNSEHDRDFARSSVRNFSAPLRVQQEEVVVVVESKETSDDGGDGDDALVSPVSPVSPWMMRLGREDENGLTLSTTELQLPATLRGHVRNGKTMWRSETPCSVEEAEAFQGLR